MLWIFINFLVLLLLLLFSEKTKKPAASAAAPKKAEKAPAKKPAAKADPSKAAPKESSKVKRAKKPKPNLTPLQKRQLIKQRLRQLAINKALKIQKKVCNCSFNNSKSNLFRKLLKILQCEIRMLCLVYILIVELSSNES